MQPPPVTLPAKDRTAHPATLLRRRALSQWIASLPLANPTASAEQLLVALRRLNRHPRPIPRLSSLLECYLKPIRQLMESLRSNRSANREKAAALALILEPLTLELAHGYKRLLNEQAAVPGEPKAAQLAGPIYQAVRALEMHRLIRYHQYRPPSRSLWREILQLYLYAELLGVSRTEIREADTPDGPPMDIRLLLKRNLLLDLFDPSRLPQGQLWALHDYLTRRGQKPRLGNFRRLRQGEGVFLIDSRGIERHRRYDPQQIPEQTRTLFQFDTTPLNQEIHAQLQRQKTDPDYCPEGLEPLSAEERIQLLHDLLVAWHLHPSRRHPREPRQQWLQGVNGITQVNRSLEHNGMAEPPSGPTPPRRPDQLFATCPLTRIRWRQINISRSGIALRCSTPQERIPVQVGQLILLHNEQRQGNWSLGVVRRLLSRGPDDIEVGVQFIHGRVTPAGIRPQWRNSDPSGDFQPALLLQHGGQQPDVLFTPRLIYREGQQYLLERQDGEQTTVTAGRLLETTANYQRFEFTPLTQG